MYFAIVRCLTDIVVNETFAAKSKGTSTSPGMADNQIVNLKARCQTVFGFIGGTLQAEPLSSTGGQTPRHPSLPRLPCGLRLSHRCILSNRHL